MLYFIQERIMWTLMTITSYYYYAINQLIVTSYLTHVQRMLAPW